MHLKSSLKKARKDGSMSQSSKKSLYTTLATIALALLIAKLGWVVVEHSFLPKSGINKENIKEVKPLYYRYTLASKKEKPKVATTTKIVTKKAPPPKPLEIKKFTLDGVYVSKSVKLASIVYKTKKVVLSIGEELEGFKLKNVDLDFAIFTKDGKDYRVDLRKDKTKANKSISSSSIPKPITHNKIKKDKISKDGDTRVIPKNLFNKYKGNIAEIQKNISVLPFYQGKKLKGFRVNFVRANSEFSQLGLKRGDIITAINGEELKDFSVPMRYFNNMDSLTAATITVKRGNETKELEYEVR